MGPAIPIVGGIAVLSLVGLRLRAISKTKAAAGGATAGAAKPGALPVITASTSIADAAAKLGVPGADHPLRPGSRSPTMDELIQQLKDPANFARSHPEIDFSSASDAQVQAAFDAFTAQNPAAAAGTGVPPGTLKGDGVAAVGQQAIVTTNDPAPSGDLIIRSAPSGSAQQIGGAEKDGTVSVLDASDATFAKIAWGGGSRLPAATGFARKAFLKLV